MQLSCNSWLVLAGGLNGLSLFYLNRIKMKQISIILAVILLTMLCIILIDLCLAGISAPSTESLIFGVLGFFVTIIVWYKSVTWLISKFK
jgi:hypothetical protein